MSTIHRDIDSPFNDYLTKQQFCAAVPGGPISERTADRWDALRVGPPRVKCGRKVLYSKHDVRQWLESRTQRPLREMSR